MKVYLFRRKNSKVVHAVKTKWASMGDFELDRIFGGGMKIPCGQPTEGDGVLSEIPMATHYVSCMGCRQNLKITKPVKSWKLKHERKLDRPRILGIPG